METPFGESYDAKKGRDRKEARMPKYRVMCYRVAAQPATGRTSRHTPVASIEDGSGSPVSVFAALQGISRNALRFAAFSGTHAEFPPQ
jgi:hypothetical protein